MRDLRMWLDQVKAADDLLQLNQVHWDQEIGIVTAEMSTRKGPAVLFDKIPDVPQGFRVLTNMLVTRKRIALTCNLPECASDNEFIDMLGDKPEKWEKKALDFKHKQVETSPLFENMLQGEKVDTGIFPTPRWHEEDGGRYIGTGCAVIMRDPDTGHVNLGTYRVMVYDKNKVTVYISPGKHGNLVLQKYKQRKQKCPVAISLGHDPLILMVSSLPIPAHICEYDYAGAILGEPIETVAGPVTGLPLPASGEIVLEGFIDPENLVPEGPFGEWTGYYAGGTEMAPLMKVEAILHRNDPIITGCSPARRGDEYEVMHYLSFLRSALIKKALIGAGIPGVKGVYAPAVGGSRLLVNVSIEQKYAGHARQAAFVASQCYEGAYAGRYVVVVDHDIDATDMNEVLWAILTRSDPHTDIDIIRRAWSTRLDPMSSAYSSSGSKNAFFNSRGIIDACIPYERLGDFPNRISYAKDRMEEVLKKFNLANQN